MKEDQDLDADCTIKELVCQEIVWWFELKADSVAVLAVAVVASTIYFPCPWGTVTGAWCHHQWHIVLSTSAANLAMAHTSSSQLASLPATAGAARPNNMLTSLTRTTSTFWNSVCTVLFYYSAPTHNTDWCILCYKTKGSTTLTGVRLPEQSTTVNKLNCISTRRSMSTVYCKQLLKTFGLKHPTIEFTNSCAPQRKLDTSDLPVPLQHPKILCGHGGGHQCDNWSGCGYH